MEFSWGLSLICVGVVGTVVSLICLVKSLQAVETATYSDIDEIIKGYADNLNNNETASNKKSVHTAQTSVHSDDLNISPKHTVYQDDETVLDEDTMYSRYTDVPNIEMENITSQDDETVLDEDTMTEIAITK